ncbi:MAG TPA: LysR substrate-binding domain-containing protein [Steroidobacteraceae bacterium]|nr:LysR substrate-binding domain-containing protein [Steroidobacteraceae bacterium]
MNWLRAFEVAARHLSFSAAAAELSVTPAAVSQQVRLLEARLGQPLFLRHARGLHLTPAGEALVPPCRESFERLEAALRELFGRHAHRQLVIRVALGFARSWLLERIAEFACAHPELPVRLLASVWSAEAPDPSVDADIRLAATRPAGLQCDALTQDELFPVCSPALARRGPRLRRPADLRAYPLLTTIGFAQGWRHWFAAAGLKGSLPAAGIEFDSMRLALDTAALGHGVALGRTSYVGDFLADRRLVAPFELRLKATDNIYLILPAKLEPGAPAALFRDWILASPGIPKASTAKK